MRGHAQRVFHVAPGTLDTAGAELTSEERDERVARRLCGWYTQQSPQQVVDGFGGCPATAGDHHVREIEPGRMTGRRNELARGLLPADVAGDAGVELLVPLERRAVECAHVRGIADRRGRADVVAVAQPLAEHIVGAGGKVPVPGAGRGGDEHLAGETIRAIAPVCERSVMRPPTPSRSAQRAS